MRSKVLLLLSFFILFFLSCTTKYYLVRHAEKACEDYAACSLTDQLSNRAIALRDSLIHKGIYSIFTSESFRTQLTT